MVKIPEKIYKICHKYNGIEHILHSDGNFYFGYVYMRGCSPKIYKSKKYADKLSLQMRDTYVVEMVYNPIEKIYENKKSN